MAGGACSADPVFIVGVPRSGTTLLRVMLDSHANIACGPEFSILTDNVARIWGRQWPSIESLSWDVSLKIFGNFKFTEADVDRFAARFVDDVFSAYAVRRNKQRWAIKVPRLVEKLAYVARLFPHASVIHIVRDGRDVVASSLEQCRKRPDWYPDYDAAGFARDWVSMIAQARRDAGALRAYREVHYEALVSEPRSTLEGLLCFLGESWDGAVLRHHEVQHDYGAGELSTEQVKQPLSAEAVGAWRRRLSQDDAEAIGRVDGFCALLRAEGYL
jgi:protein-tyrosine sulfotransferase